MSYFSKCFIIILQGYCCFFFLQFKDEEYEAKRTLKIFLNSHVSKCCLWDSNKHCLASKSMPTV